MSSRDQQVDQVAVLEDGRAVGQDAVAEAGEEGDPGAGRPPPGLAAGWPTQPACTGTSASATVPVGSRHSLGSAPSGSSRRSIWSAVQRTVATVGMPSRW